MIAVLLVILLFIFLLLIIKKPQKCESYEKDNNESYSRLRTRLLSRLPKVNNVCSTLQHLDYDNDVVDLCKQYDSACNDKSTSTAIMDFISQTPPWKYASSDWISINGIPGRGNDKCKTNTPCGSICPANFNGIITKCDNGSCVYV